MKFQEKNRCRISAASKVEVGCFVVEIIGHLLLVRADSLTGRSSSGMFFARLDFSHVQNI